MKWPTTLEKSAAFGLQNQNGWCFVDYSGEHYDMDHDQLVWSKAIANGVSNVSVHRPPSSLYKLWTKTGAVIFDPRRSLLKQEREEAKLYHEESKIHREESKDFMQEYATFQKQQLQLQMTDSMSASVQRSTARRERQEQIREERER